MDMREHFDFPRPPSTKEEVYDPNAKPWLLACALVGRYDARQYNTYSKYWGLLGDDCFRRILDATRVILAESNNIKNPAAFLTTQLIAELSLGDYRGVSFS